MEAKPHPSNSISMISLRIYRPLDKKRIGLLLLGLGIRLTSHGQTGWDSTGRVVGRVQHASRRCPWNLLSMCGARVQYNSAHDLDHSRDSLLADQCSRLREHEHEREHLQARLY